MSAFEDTLPEASADWVKAGLITEAQRTGILARHPVTAGGSARFVAVLASIGGLLFAIGVSLLIKANWRDIGDWTKIGGLVALLVAAYAAGWHLKLSPGRFPKTGDMCLMVGALFFLGGIALVSQVFHLNSRPATGVLVWWLGIVAVPWIARAKGAQFISIIAGLTWLGMEMTTPGSWLQIQVGTARFNERDMVVMQAVFGFLGIALWLAGLALRRGRFADFAAMHEGWGILLLGLSLYGLGFARHIWDWHAPAGVERVWPAYLLGLTLATAAGIGAWRHSRIEVKRLLPWLALCVIPLASVHGIGALGDGGWLWSALAWLALFLISIALVRIGLETGRESWVNLGIGFIALNILTRYFDLFGTMLEGGVFFVVTGALVVGLGIFLERKRRALVATLREEAHP